MGESKPIVDDGNEETIKNSENSKSLSEGFLKEAIKLSPKPDRINDKVKSLSYEDLYAFSGDLDNLPLRFPPWKSVTYLNEYDGMIIGNLVSHPELKWKKLCVQFNNLGDAGASAILTALHVNTNLELLFLEGNQLTDTTAIVCAEMLKVNKSLKKIHLDFNRLTDVGAEAIAESLKENSTLDLLDISFNKFTNRGKTLLREAVKGKKGFSLW
eukprot:CAMPEP_0204828994 /NCGR_PEP_ID=MMETSP1346-20131115/6969_1 /ASSEMBLY_ACC=CAM_ASM_000771 /TAXON_ID=215587 /ORGANISM="Aplanochytrium stocchinoi, Strain GSBS06" /LENGTH=212 /DNA_ID=CAMNT_0051958439 /DNA_START=62 /DNA_END=697 /DNA_ORIENTATION=+